MTLAAGLVTSLGADIAYHGFLSAGNPGRAALIGLAGGVVTLAHAGLAAGLFRGGTVARYVALPVFVVWLALGLAAFANGGKSSAGWMGLVVAGLAAVGLAGVLDAMRAAREP